MKKLIATILCILLFIPLAAAHSIETKYVIRSDGQYNIKFSTDPEFPLTNKETHLDFEIWDNKGKPVSVSDIKVSLAKDNERKTLVLTQIDDHYELEHIFKETGVYQINPFIDGQKLNIDFYVEVDSFGLYGILRSSVIILFLLILIWLMYKDCKIHKRKEVKEWE